jgi:hypothetical protein
MFGVTIHGAASVTVQGIAGSACIEFSQFQSRQLAELIAAKIVEIMAEFPELARPGKRGVMPLSRREEP